MSKSGILVALKEDERSLRTQTGHTPRFLELANTRPTCSLTAPFVRPNDAHGKAAKHKSMVDPSTAYNLFLNRPGRSRGAERTSHRVPAGSAHA